MLWNVVEEQIKEARQRKEGWFYPSVVAQVFAYHTVEAYLNYVGERIAPNIWANERNYFRNEPCCGALGKFRKVTDLVGLPWAADKRPLKTALELKEIRDLIAHGKEESLAGEVLHPFGTEAPYPTSTLRRLTTPKDRLDSVLVDVEALLNDIHLRAKPLLKVNDPYFGDKALRGPIQISDYITS